MRLRTKVKLTVLLIASIALSVIGGVLSEPKRRSKTVSRETREP